MSEFLLFLLRRSDDLLLAHLYIHLKLFSENGKGSLGIYAREEFAA